jgi:hypothetical protein
MVALTIPPIIIIIIIIGADEPRLGCRRGETWIEH